MKLKLLTLFAIWVAGAEAYTPLPINIANKATKQLNKFRANVHPKAQDMQPIKYDHEAQAKLDAIIEANGPSWMYDVNPNPPFDFHQNLNGYFIGKQIGMSEPFWGWHDTCTRLGENCILTNFNFRMAQYDKCFDYSSCNSSNGGYDRFKSCETPLNEVGSGHPCSFAWVYIGQMLRANANRLACSVLDVPGWMPPSHQLNSYWCFTDGTPPSSDQPYTAKPRLT